MSSLSRLVPPLLLVLGLALPAAHAESRRLADHVVLISVDGLRPEFYLDPAWPAPAMQQMAREGAHAKGVRSVFPSVTYPAHATMITGALPARHGIVNNSPFEPEGETGRWYWETEAIQGRTLWDAAAAAQLGSASVGWPVSVGAPVDYNLPEIWSIDPQRDAIDAQKAATRPTDLWEELEREATGRLTLENFNYGVLARDDRAGEISAYLLASRRPGLMTVHLVETDDFQHRDGRGGNRVARAVAAADRAISRIVEAADRVGILERTAFVITGDHGFIEHEVRVKPNVWLVEAGLMEAARDRDNWRATFHKAAGAALLYLADDADAGTLDRVRATLEGRPGDERRLFRILERGELDRRGADPRAALGLSPAPGTTLSSSSETPAVEPARGGNHGHVPELPQMLTGFIGWGAGLRPGASVASMGLVDVAPIVARLLDLDFEAPDGGVPAGVLGE